MIRTYSERHELVEGLSRSVLLVNPVGVHLYFEHRDIMTSIAPLLTKLLLCEQESSRRRELEHIEELMIQQERMIEEEHAITVAATPGGKALDKVGNDIVRPRPDLCPSPCITLLFYDQINR